MEAILLEILEELRRSDHFDDIALGKLVRKHNRGLGKSRLSYSKRTLLPYYLEVKENDPARWESWDIDAVLERRLLQALRMKPNRTASGVATITVITKPWACSSDCLYCPNDLRMPKSYLSDEPACQRAERTYFDPYLQVVSRLRVLEQMGHVTDKIELIVLGGTWSDYPVEYQTWFISELFRGLNAGDDAEQEYAERCEFYEREGVGSEPEALDAFVAEFQQQVNVGEVSYNQAVQSLYGNNDAWRAVSLEQKATLDDLTRQQRMNETAQHRVVGLVIETRPDAITSENLTLFREFGCTKVQMGIQSIDPAVLALNNRNIDLATIQNAFDLLRVFGFKIHTHFMLNLYGSSAEKDKNEYQRFVSEGSYQPDEVKLYPCMLVAGTGLCENYTNGTWQPYSEEELIDVLVSDTLVTPPFTRISRMIRDISAHDIVAGNKKANLRQMVEREIEANEGTIAEIRYREIRTGEPDPATLTLKTLPYETTNTHEYFLQWVTPENKIAGFLRLSLPKADYVREHQSTPAGNTTALVGSDLPVGLGEAMIREVHVYGKVAALNVAGENAQHLGLGKQLIEKACALAKEQGYTKMNVISSVGTREYYRGLGFKDNDLYQQRELSLLP